ncbi:hypothetical protein FN846DRAFT_959663 [Sphaerosporella brunnea]|uniref:Uncharacterized protein n=1 Tax=Sphaerosporella brunnea TaxID=1250544 RepID=A0A5J5EQA7_9PEZI|nr:hypothetical protein FN846DRAFT_959663 [Sphaerosporella brunnea]
MQLPVRLLLFLVSNIAATLAAPITERGLPSIAKIKTLSASAAFSVASSNGYTVICNTYAGSPEMADAINAAQTLSQKQQCVKPAHSGSTYTLLSIQSASLGLVGSETWSLPCAVAAELFALVAVACQADVDGMVRAGGQLKYAAPDHSLRLAYET